MKTSTETFFLATRGGGLRYCVLDTPQACAGHPRAVVLHVHAFAEEMNKMRRMAALQARAMAARGWAVLRIDLLGCGDSSGDFGHASWQAWLDDLGDARDWLRQRFDAPLWLWGERAGALLASQLATGLDEPASLLFWQPQPTGGVVLQQFLRLKAAANLASGGGRNAVAELRAELNRGHTVEVAGYALAPALASGLEIARMAAPRPPARVAWLELVSDMSAGLAPASAAVVAAWRSAGIHVDDQVCRGPPFWQTTEIEEAPHLIDATLTLLERNVAAL